MGAKGSHLGSWGQQSPLEPIPELNSGRAEASFSHSLRFGERGEDGLGGGGGAGWGNILHISYVSTL